MTDLNWWCALIRTPDLGAVSARALVDRYGGPREAFAARETKLPEPDWHAVERDLEWLARPSHHLVTQLDPRYPPLAIVGSRNPTTAGVENADAFAAHLAACGLVIVSGLALGIDAAAHRGALRGGRTVAVCGTGLDEVYPARHKRLASEIAASGALVSEFPTGCGPQVENFPRRNRIISGLAAGTLVVEAAIRSGSLITARLAAEQGREVFAIPGSIHNPLAKGCHQVIRQGAKLVDSADHILEELGALLGFNESRPEGRSHIHGQTGSADAALDNEYEKLLDSMEETPLSIDKLVSRSGLTPDMVSSMLLIMELRGIVESAPGGGYARRPKRT
ncbi:MAG: DNA-processing protein DprA [Xanthomonadaceae bacterium]|nr:DNA-processing protein DprA [Xanthomonadaceae bacterium]